MTTMVWIFATGGHLFLYYDFESKPREDWADWYEIKLRWYNWKCLNNFRLIFCAKNTHPREKIRFAHWQKMYLLEYGIFQEYFKKKVHNGNVEILEYGISQEYSKKKVHNRNMENLGIWNIPWNIPGIFQKIENSSGGRKV